MKKIFLAVAAFILCSANVCLARVNFLNENAPGIDLKFSQNVWQNNTSLFYESNDDFSSLNALYCGYMGLNPFLEVGFDWSLKQLNPKQGDTRTGLTDINVAAKYNLFKKSEITEDDPIFLGETLLTIPSGDSTKGLGAGGYGIGAGMVFGIFYDPLIYSALLNSIMYTRGNNRKEGSVINYAASVEYTYNSEITTFGKIKGRSTSDSEVNGRTVDDSKNELYLGAGFDYKIDKQMVFSTNIMVGVTKKSSDLLLYTSLKF